MRTLNIDLETYSSVPITEGVHKYVESDDFEILLLAYSLDGGPVEVIDMTREDEIPPFMMNMLKDHGTIKTAYNAAFEINCLQQYIPDMDITNWQCTMVMALSLALPAGLDKTAKALDLPIEKDTRGTALIRYFSIPCNPTKSNGGRTRNLPEHAPDKWETFIEYCRKDVQVERAVRNALLKYGPSDGEWDMWYLDQQINDRGVRVDAELVEGALYLDEQNKKRLMDRARALAPELDNPNSTAQLLTWLHKHAPGIEIPDIRKATVASLLKRDDLPTEARDMLTIRKLAGKTSVKKYLAMQNSVCKDGRVRGLFQFYGAGRTGRWAGRRVQLQNLPRNYLEDLDTARKAIKSKDIDLMEMLYDDVGDTLSQLIRTALIPADGCRFIVADFSAIEARVIAWLAGEKWRMDVFKNGGDIYCMSASKMFGVPVEKHGVNGHLRQKGKVAELACGYGGGTGALIAMGALDGGIAESELPAIVQQWRDASPHIVRFWHDVEKAARYTLTTGQSCRVPYANLTFMYKKPWLFILLPSGRKLAYRNATISIGRHGRDAIVYDGTAQASGNVTQLETYGGKLVENIVQAVARDCLAESMMALNRAGYKIVAHIHDEVVIEAREGFGSLDDVVHIMTQPTMWRSGLVLDAAGFESYYYMKD